MKAHRVLSVFCVIGCCIVACGARVEVTEPAADDAVSTPRDGINEVEPTRRGQACKQRAIPRVMPAPVAVREPIDRFALVNRHKVLLTEPDPLAPLSVGNGEFAFTVDVTGLQTFPEFYETGMPLRTLSQWGWHRFENPDRYVDWDVATLYDGYGRGVPYLDGQGTLLNASNPERAKLANDYLRANPHRLDLGRLGLELHHADGTLAHITDLSSIHQTLDLWRGEINSRFDFEGQPVQVTTLVHPTQDVIGVHVESPLVATGALRIQLGFAYPKGDWQGTLDWEAPDQHQTLAHPYPHGCEFQRVLDADQYHAHLVLGGRAQLLQTAPHHYSLVARNEASIEAVVAFSKRTRPLHVPEFADLRHASHEHWRNFWSTGGAIDLSGSSDARANELERRIVLSQYLTAIQCSGSRPPQETGLVTNSWFGKSHLEMHWWHAAHFALWGRPQLLEKSLPWYQQIMPIAREYARRQGYRGVRWPKMVSPDGLDSPSSIGVFLIWQQPHPIFYAELLRRLRPSRETLERYRELVFETAEFMASFPVRDDATGRYVLGPPLIPAQESYSDTRQQVENPTFELAYWRWGLEQAQQWRVRLGLPRDAKWDDVLRGLALPTLRNGIYPAIAVEPFTVYQDHPSMLGAFGMLPATYGIDPNAMRATLLSVRTQWDWGSTWGWDYPLIAMSAARLDEPDAAIDALLVDTPKNQYLANGHNYQRADLPLYLPGNGGLLYASAMMAAGWDGASTSRQAPGFPSVGWSVHSEGLAPAP